MSTVMDAPVPIAICAAATSSPNLSVGFVMFSNFTLNPFSLFVDALRLAANNGDGLDGRNCRSAILGPTWKATRSSCGVEVAPNRLMGSPEEFDYIAVLGDSKHWDPEVDERKMEFLQRAAKAKIPLIGICTGTFALARAGLLKGRRCCVGWNLYRVMREEFPDVISVGDQSFVVDRDRLTCAGGVTAAHLAAWLIEKHCSRALSRKALQLLFIDHALPPQTAQPHPPLLPVASNKHVRRAMLVIEQCLSEPLALSEMAHRISISQRQLVRVFEQEFRMGPREFARSYRLRHGLWLLLHSDRSITEIATECGFNDLSHFSREFRRAFGSPPSAARIAADRADWSRALDGGQVTGSMPDTCVNRRHRAFV